MPWTPKTTAFNKASKARKKPNVVRKIDFEEEIKKLEDSEKDKPKEGAEKNDLDKVHACSVGFYPVL